jgi:peptide deformylase
MQLVKAPNEWLDKSVKPFDFNELDPVGISGKMCEIMMAQNGIGLSANQVGLDAQIFVMRPLEHPEIKKPFAIINPSILEISEEKKNGPEGCLSYPGLMLYVKRPVKILTQFLDLDGKECIIEFSGIDARCFLHEFDHLNGVTFTDRVSKLKLDIAKKKLKKQKRLIHG